MAMNAKNLAALAASILVSWLAACTEVRRGAIVDAPDVDDVQVTEAVDPTCVGCHGRDGSAAPPVDLKGSSLETARGVGAHAVHLANNALGHDVACDDCHKVPATVDAAGHADTAWPAEVVFAGLALHDGAEPALEAGPGPAATVTCSSVYCHGATLAGGKLTAPAWNPPNPAASKCDACHGFPPPSPHPAYGQCDRCHAPVVSADGTIADRARHIDGVVDVLLVTECTSCHGSDEVPAPPVDLKGQTDPASPGVGAHRSHLNAAHSLSSPIACKQCHLVPASVDATGHLDDGTAGADLTFGALATDDGDVTPAYDRATNTCSSTYCHGATLSGGAITAPVWNQVDDSQAACGACHGVPPAAPHPQSHECGQCHPATAVGLEIAHPEKHIDGVLDVAGVTACNACHGSDDNNAPPFDTAGQSDPARVTVGAHQAHLTAPSGLAKAVTCDQCHRVPGSLDAEGHLGAAPAELTFGTLATAASANPTWDHAAATCSSTYCHGATLKGGTNPSPVWTVVDGTEDACGSCHGVPPPAPHVQLTTCGLCHTETAVGTTIANPDKHINGVLEVGTSLACSNCHGSADNAAPPVDTTGGAETSLVTVGAHQSHLTATGGLSSPLHCTDCHAQPAAVGDPGHLDAAPAEVQFGALAQAAGATPAWDRTDGTCSSTYCHGATLAGGAITTPIWTIVDGSEEACGACHGVPPPAPHVPLTSCGVCHAATAVGSAVAHPEAHINGQLDVDLDLSCNACHGSADNAAPPVDTLGRAEVTLVTVGAHQPHLLASSALAAPLACTDCHAQPATVAADGHLGPAPAEVQFGARATAQGAEPAWDRDDATCSSTYCHGATLNAGGTRISPVWTKVDGTEDACGACHGVPPPSPHVQLSNCGTCHTATAVGATIAHPEKHVDGTLQVNTSLACNTCHGSADNAAPPVDTTGGSAATLVTVGAHQAHVTAATGLSSPLDCDACHVKPASMGAVGHLGAAPAEVVFGALAGTGVANPVWDRAGATCSSTYCHGATLGAGGTATAPVWTQVDGSQSACGACHGNPPPAPHVQLAACGLCHGATATGGAIAHPEKHVNGMLDVDTDQGCSVCHGSAANPAPPTDTNGGSATTLLTVGAHQAHLTASSGLASPVACEQCHAVPAEVDAAGHVDPSPAELAFGALATAHGAAATWSPASATCSSTYCHGATLNAGGTKTTPVWTTVDNTQDTCGACHGNPPPAPHVQLVNCGICHAATAEGGALAHPENHIDGTLDVDLNQACDACHGSAASPAPPVDTYGGSDPSLTTVGAHQAHLKALSGLSAPVTCVTCHVVPSTGDAPGHVDPAPAEVALVGLAAANGAAPAWNAGTATCSSTYCHGATLNAGGTATTPRWTKVDGSQDACGACHGNPPPAPHVSQANCGLCHAATATGGAVTHPEKHIDGTLDVETDLACNACHGSATNAAPPTDTNGGSATTSKTVGAHQAHLQATSALSSPVACTTCHVVPATTDAAGHLGTSPAEVALTGLAASGGASPAWNAGAATCSSTYCHGATLNAGGSKTTPLWTQVDGTQDTCGACHGNPPPAPHVSQANCGLCHAATATGGAVTHPEKHIDGTLDVALPGACNACHGGAANSAPPVDTNGNSSTALKTVGAHQAHLLASSALSSPVACGECHTVPATTGASGHLGASPAELAFGTLSNTGAANGVWNATAGTCSTTYCHGATLNGGSNKTPLWTKVDNTQDACGACHGSPPNSGRHQLGDHSGINCRECHNTVTSGTSMAITGPALHINGVKDVALRSGGTWNSATKSCNPACHGDEDW